MNNEFYKQMMIEATILNTLQFGYVNHIQSKEELDFIKAKSQKFKDKFGFEFKEAFQQKSRMFIDSLIKLIEGVSLMTLIFAFYKKNEKVPGNTFIKEKMMDFMEDYKITFEEWLYQEFLVKLVAFEYFEQQMNSFSNYMLLKKKKQQN